MEDVFGVGKAIEKLAEPVADLIKRVAGPAADEIGLTIQDSVRVYRAGRALKLFEKFRENCQARGFNPRQVPLKLLLPIIDAASVEDDEDLHSLWANLLTNVADPGAPPRPYRAFVEVLKQLSPEEARLYNALFDQIESSIKVWNSLKDDTERAKQMHNHPYNMGYNYDLVRLYLDANHMPTPYIEPSQTLVLLPMTMDIAVSLDNLRRLGLLPPGFAEHLPDFAIMFAASIRQREPSAPADASRPVSPSATP
jgi:hypothetical protein